MSNNKRFREEKFVAIRTDLDKIRTKPGMYISHVGRKGALHLGKEMVNNSIDEAIHPDSPGKTLKVCVDERYNELTVGDDGRGFPFHVMIDACTVIQSSTKFTRDSGGETAGENGVGITATNALAKKFSITSYRYGETAKLEFKDGVMVKEPIPEKIDDVDKHGSVVTFIPDEKYMGECKIEPEAMLEWLNIIKHVLSPKITIEFTVINEEGKKAKTKIRNGNGLSDMVKEMEPKLLREPVHLKDSVKFVEKVRNVVTGDMEEAQRFLGVEFAFSFKDVTDARTISEPVVNSMCNFVHTIDGGVHADATRNTIANFLVNATRSILSQKDAEKFDITSQDATFGMVLAVYLGTNTNPGFTGQTKEKVGDAKLYKKVADLVKLMLTEYFKVNPKELKKLCDYVKLNAKGRYEATNARVKVVRSDTSYLSEHDIKGYVPANNKSKNAYRELFLIEGDSVKGNGDKARDNNVQALFCLKGVPFNTFNKPLHVVDKNTEFHNLLHVLRCGAGKSYKEENLYFDKIIIMTDGDYNYSPIY